MTLAELERLPRKWRRVANEPHGKGPREWAAYVDADGSGARLLESLDALALEYGRPS